MCKALFFADLHPYSSAALSLIRSWFLCNPNLVLHFSSEFAKLHHLYQAPTHSILLGMDSSCC